VVVKIILPCKAKIEYKLWRKKIFERDNFICTKCGERSNKLEAHHKILLKLILEMENVEERDSILFDIDNGITLCKKCHKKLHKTEGR